MKLNKINGNTYYIDNPTNIGVYVFKNKYCTIIDTGINNTVAGKIIEVLEKNNLKPKYIINTHNHGDHSGGNMYFKDNYPGCIFHASQEEIIFLQNDSLFSTCIYGSSPTKELRKRNAKSRSVKIDVILEPGMNKINEEKFEIHSLKGHSPGQIGIGTPEGVIFMGDSLFSEENIEKHPFPFLFDIEEQFQTIEYIKTLRYDTYVLSHGIHVYDSTGIKRLCEINKQNIERHLNDIKEMLDQPLTRDELLEQILVLNDVEMNYKEYYICYSSIGAFIAYLYNNDVLDYSIENGKLYYFRK